MSRSNGQGAIDAAVVLAILGLFAAPYLTSWGGPHAHYLVPDLLIVCIARWRFRGDTMRRLGLSIPARDLLRSTILLAGGLLIVGWLMHQITAGSQLDITGHRPFFSASQVLHQELVLRGLLLGTLASRIPSRVALAALAAIGFAGLHPLLYWWRWDELLPVTAGLTLFCFAMATNLLYLRAGHFGLAFALHAAWNLNRFGTSYGRDSLGRPITEWASFAHIEGSPKALAASLVLLAVVLVLEARSPRTTPTTTTTTTTLTTPKTPPATEATLAQEPKPRL